MPNNDEDKEQLIKTHPRTVGAANVLISAVLIYLGAIGPLMDAMRGTSEVNISMKVAVLGFILLETGFAYVIGGPRMVRRFNHRDSSKILKNVSAVVMVGIAFLAYFALKSHIESLGYSFRGNGTETSQGRHNHTRAKLAPGGD